jgi:hypothetical protein
MDVVAKGWPNPVTETITIETKHGETIRLYDMTGREVYQQYASGSKHILDMNGLLTGLYLLQITDNQGRTTTQQIVKASAQ